MKKIKIDVGVYTALEVDLTDYNFTGVDKVVLSIKNYLTLGAKIIIEREFYEAKKYEIIITPEESKQLIKGACYDFDKIMEDGKRYKETELGMIELVEVVGVSNE